MTWENACLHMRLPTSTPTAGNHSPSTQQWRPSHKLVSNALSQPGNPSNCLKSASVVADYGCAVLLIFMTNQPVPNYATSHSL
jgi:hypothetical protein